MTESSGKKNPLRKALVITIALCAVTFLSLLFSIVMVVRMSMAGSSESESAESSSESAEEETVMLTHEEAQRMVERASESGEQMGREAVLKELRSALQNKNDFLPVLRKLYSDDLIVDDNGTYRFAAVNNNLGMSPYDPADFYSGSGTAPVYRGTAGRCVYGVDVSENTEISSWEELSKGKNFAIVRVGYRETGTGELYTDEAFEENMEQAAAMGLQIGISFISSASDAEEVLEEAEFVISEIEPYREDITYPVIFIPGKGLVGGKRDITLASELCETFAGRLEEEGYVPMIGGTISDFILRLDMTELDEYRKYVRDHSAKPYFPYEYQLWQYGGEEEGTDGGVTPGTVISFYSPS
ncbi:MAG: hypothetical protein K6E33_04965 [Lachnospiraceae bacterium]|nr:hypothetical protein [Lachnospiraceae bacterium]